MTLISPHFSLEEMTASREAAVHGIDNTPNSRQRASLGALCFNIMEPIRDHYGVPVHVSSGLRVEAVNAITPGASKTSQHCLGEACDFHVQGIPVGAAALWIACSNLPFDELILEYPQEQNPMAGWTHVSYGPRNRRQVLWVTMEGGKRIERVALPVWVHTLYGSGGGK